LLQPNAVRALATKLLPLALIVTPNIPEAEVLCRKDILSDTDAEEASRVIAALGPRYVIIKGGHRGGAPMDLVFDGERFTRFDADRIVTQNTHGTGCTFSAAIAAHLALGSEPLDAIAAAKAYLTGALAASYPIGDGHSPVNHFHNMRRAEPSGQLIRRS
jgi:hydroxymethylpyrimidine/phosphomethylpyrimidine kinase